MASIGDVARVAQVSKSTVSRVMNSPELVSPETVERVRKAMQELGFSPNRLAQGLRKGRAKVLGVLVPDITNPFYTSVVRGIEDTTNSWGYSIILCNTDGDLGKERSYLEMLQGRIDGLVFTPALEKDENIDLVRQLSRPVVLLSRRILGSDFDLVKVDNVQGAFQATSYLLQLGHRRIATIAGTPGTTTGEERLAGYKEAFLSMGIQVDQSLIRYGDFKQQSGYLLTLELLNLPERPTAVFVANNFMLAGSLLAIRKLGLTIPRDISLAGFDEIPSAELIEPQITTVVQPTYDMGKAAARLLLRRIKGDIRAKVQTIVLSPKLIIRDSCRPLDPGMQSPMSQTTEADKISESDAKVVTM